MIWIFVLHLLLVLLQPFYGSLDHLRDNLGRDRPKLIFINSAETETGPKFNDVVSAKNETEAEFNILFLADTETETENP